MVHLQTLGLKYLGGAALSIGIIWFGLSNPKPGWKALSESLPNWLINNEASLGLAGFGILLLVLGDHLTSRSRPGSSREHNNGFGAPKKIFDKSEDWNRTKDKRRGAEQKKSSDSFGHSQERVALRPCWPQRETSSWVGGLPKIPEHMDWPIVGTRPATFLAQISLAGLPETLWKGAGPRVGWLVFWVGDDERRAKTIVRHVSGPVKERDQPPGVTPVWHGTMAPGGLQAAFGEVGKTPARWYLEQVDGPALGAVEDMMSETQSYYNEDLGEWIWEETWTSKVKGYLDQTANRDEIRYGVDWPCLRGMIGIWRETVQKRMHDHEIFINNKDLKLYQAKVPLEKELQLLQDNPGAEKASYEAIEGKLSIVEAKFQAKVDMAIASLQKAKSALEFGENINLEIEALEQEIPFTPELGKDILAKLNDKYPATHPHVSRDIQHFIENYARYRYTQDPGSVPDVLFNLFAPLWELQCRETLIFVGRSLESDENAQTYARLIDVPPHPLAGLTFGDSCRIYSDLRMPDLIQGHWHEASATVHYG